MSAPASMKFSLVLSTVGRVDEIARLLPTIAAQTHSNWELIVVDQSNDPRLGALFDEFAQSHSVTRIKASRGLTRARNAGMAIATGDVIAFPDDDCVYVPDLLERVAQYLSLHPECDGVCGRPLNDGYFDRKSGPISKYNAWKRGIEYAYFLRRGMVARAGTFDETHGLGTPNGWWGGDGTDYLLGALEQGCRLDYDATLIVEHPGPIKSDASDLESQSRRAYHYALGRGRVLRKRHLPIWFKGYQCLRPIGGAFISTILARRDQARIYLSVLRGLLRGIKGLSQ